VILKTTAPYLGAIFPLIFCAGVSVAQHLPDRPNFVVILGEAQGWASTSVQMDDAVPGSKSDLAQTPNIERLAARGMRFADAYAASPRCTPSRAALFTGRNPAALHMTFVGEGNGGRESGFSVTGSRLIPAQYTSELPASEVTIADLLKRLGYATAHFGKWHVGRVDPSRHGFDESDGPTNNGGPENVEAPNPKETFGMTARALDFMARQAKAGKPFYLQISHYPGRSGLDVRPETYEAVRRRAPQGLNGRRVGAIAETEDMDATIGMVLAKLDELGLAGRTYVLFTSDHGAQGSNANGALTNGKGTVWEGGVRVPFIISGPGIGPGVCSHVRVFSTDVFPTFAALAGIKEPLPVGLEGGSLVPLLMGGGSGAVKRPREEFVVHSPHYDKDPQGPASTILLGDYKLIHFYETAAPRLFDLSRDIGERRDLAKEEPEKAADLDRRLAEFLKTVNAAMPSANPSFDPSKATPPEEHGGGRKRERGVPQ